VRYSEEVSMDQEVVQGFPQGGVIGSLGPKMEAAVTALVAEGMVLGQATERKQRATACERRGFQARASGRGTTGRRSETEGQR
jgi:hypothetical protein